MTLLVLRCADTTRARDFYEALGLRLTEEKHGGGPSHYSTRIGDLVLELYPRTDADTRGLRLGFKVSDVDAACDAALSTGGRVLRTDADAHTAIVEDPDGHRIELSRAGAG